jgi:hypothetical protein
MKVKSLCSFNRSSGRDGAVKTAIKLKTAPDIVPHHAAKSTIVRGALKRIAILENADQRAVSVVRANFARLESEGFPTACQ